MVYNNNKNCFESNEFLELIKKRNKSTQSTQSPSFLVVEEKLQCNDTFSILNDSLSYDNENKIKTLEKSSNLENIQDETLLTQKSYLTISNTMDYEVRKENNSHLIVSDHKTNNLKLDSSNVLNLEISIEDVKNTNISKNKEDVVLNNLHTSKLIKDDLENVDLNQNENYENIEIITRKNTFFNKKISFTLYNNDENEKHITNHNFDYTRKKRTVIFREELNFYVYIDETKSNDSLSALLTDSRENYDLLAIYTHYLIQMTYYRKHIFKNTIFKNFRKKSSEEMKMSVIRTIDIIRPKNFAQTELKKDMKYVLEDKKVSIMKDVSYNDVSKNLGNHFLLEKILSMEYRINDRKKEFLALPYYKYNKEKKMKLENKSMISYLEIDDKSDRHTEKLPSKNEITVRKRKSRCLKEVWKNIDSAFDFIARIAIKICCCQ